MKKENTVHFINVWLNAKIASWGFKVCKSVHHHTIQINQPTRRNNDNDS